MKPMGLFVRINISHLVFVDGTHVYVPSRPDPPDGSGDFRKSTKNVYIHICFFLLIVITALCGMRSRSISVA